MTDSPCWNFLHMLILLVCRGGTESTRHAVQLINALIQDPAKELEDLIPRNHIRPPGANTKISSTYTTSTGATSTTAASSKGLPSVVPTSSMSFQSSTNFTAQQAGKFGKSMAPGRQAPLRFFATTCLCSSSAGPSSSPDYEPDPPPSIPMAQFGGTFSSAPNLGVLSLFVLWALVVLTAHPNTAVILCHVPPALLWPTPSILLLPCPAPRLPLPPPLLPPVLHPPTPPRLLCQEAAFLDRAQVWGWCYCGLYRQQRFLGASCSISHQLRTHNPYDPSTFIRAHCLHLHNIPLPPSQSRPASAPQLKRSPSQSSPHLLQELHLMGLAPLLPCTSPRLPLAPRCCLYSPRAGSHFSHTFPPAQNPVPLPHHSQAHLTPSHACHLRPAAAQSLIPAAPYLITPPPTCPVCPHACSHRHPTTPWLQGPFQSSSLCLCLQEPHRNPSNSSNNSLHLSPAWHRQACPLPLFQCPPLWPW